METPVEYNAGNKPAEEKILVLRANPNGKPGHLMKFSISRKEAIDIMARAIHFYEWGHHNNMPKWDELNSDIQNDYRNMAKAALDELLKA